MSTTTVTVQENTVLIQLNNVGIQGPQGATGVVAATAPITYDSGTQTVAINQAGLTLTQSQITNLVTDLANTAKLNSANAFTVGGHVITNDATAVVPLVVKGVLNQSANLQEWQNSAGTARAKVDSVGNIFGVTYGGINQFVFVREENSGGSFEAKKQTATATNPGANNGKIYFRDGTNAGTLKLVVRAGAAGAETTILDNIPQ